MHCALLEGGFQRLIQILSIAKQRKVSSQDTNDYCSVWCLADISDDVCLIREQ